MSRNPVDKRLATYIRSRPRGAPAFIPYEPGRLYGDNGPFDPFTGGSFPFPFDRR
jgi:hypothetical protein